MNKQQNCKVCLRSQVSIGKKCSKEDVAYSISLLSGRWRKTPQESTLENLTRYQKCWALEKGTPSKCGIFWDCFIEIKTDVWFSISDRNTEAVPDCPWPWLSWTSPESRGADPRDLVKMDRLEPLLWKCLSPILIGKRCVTDFIVDKSTYLAF